MRNNCLWHKNKTGCRRDGLCPYDCAADAAVRCANYIQDDKTKTSAIDKLAAWADVSDKAHAIVATGGVEIVEENAQEVRAYVMSGQVADRFPVTDGGPYEVILSKKSWGNKGNVGGWLQGYLCSCAWGYWNSGEPGPRYRGRLCSHSFAALLVANMRARQDFMGDRAAMKLAYTTSKDYGWENYPYDDWKMRGYLNGSFAIVMSPHTEQNPGEQYLMRFQKIDHGPIEEYYGNDLEALMMQADEMAWEVGGLEKKPTLTDG